MLCYITWGLWTYSNSAIWETVFTSISFMRCFLGIDGIDEVALMAQNDRIVGIWHADLSDGGRNRKSGRHDKPSVSFEQIFHFGVSGCSSFPILLKPPGSEECHANHLRQTLHGDVDQWWCRLPLPVWLCLADSGWGDGVVTLRP